MDEDEIRRKAWEELGRRNKLPPTEQGLYDEATNRGLITSVPQVATQTIEEPDYATVPSEVTENFLKSSGGFQRKVDVTAQGVAEGIGFLTGLPIDAISGALNLPRYIESKLTDDPKIPFVDTSTVIGGGKSNTEAIREIFRKFGINPSQAELGNLVENLLQIGGSAVVPGGLLLQGSKFAAAPSKIENLRNIGASTKSFIGTNVVDQPALTKALQKSGDLAPKKPVNPLFKEIADNPSGFTKAEAAVTGVAGSGRTIAEQTFPESDTAGFIGELLGIPLGVASVVAVNKVPQIWQWGKNLKDSDKNLMKAAEEVQDRLTGTVEEALDNLNKATDTPIAAGELTGDIGLLNFNRGLDTLHAEIALARQRDVYENLTKKLDDLAEDGVPDEFIKQAKKELGEQTDNFNNQLNVALKNASDEIDQLGVTDRVEASKIVRKNLEDNLELQILEEQNLWTNLNLDTTFNSLDEVSNTMSTISKLKIDGKKARVIPNDTIAYIERHLLTGEIVDGKKVTKLREDVDAQTIQNIRSEVLNEQRKVTSGANPDRNRAALLGELQESLLDDLLDLKNVDPELTKAISHTKQLNDTFRRGKIGELLGNSSDGSLRVDPDLTLKKIIVKNEEGAVNLRSLVNADNSTQTNRAIGEYVEQLFLSDATKDGVVNVNKAQQFLKNYKFVIDELPEVKTKLNRVIASGSTADDMVQVTKLGQKEIDNSALATFLNIEDPTKVIRGIKRSAKPSETLELIVRTAKGDKSGNALRGLQRLVADDILKELQSSRQSPGSDVRIMSSDKAVKTVGENTTYRKALKSSGLFDDDQLRLIDSITTDLQKYEQIASTKLRGQSGTSQDILSKDELLGKMSKMVGLKFLAPHVTKKSGGGSLALASTIGQLTEALGKKVGLTEKNELVLRALTGGDKESRDLLKLLLTTIRDRQTEKKIVAVLRGHLISARNREKEREKEVKTLPSSYKTPMFLINKDESAR